MANSVGRIDLDLGINTSGFKNQLNGITKQSNQLSGAFGKLGKAAAAAFSVKAIVSFAKSCISLGSDLAEVQNVVDVTFGGMSSAVNEWAKNAITSYGLSEKVAKEYMGQFGAMSKAFGNTEQMAYKQAAALTGLAGDVASFYNMTTDEAFTKLKSVYTGETESLKSLGVVMTQSALDQYALAHGYGKTMNAMTEQEKVSLRLAFVTDKLSDASGDFIRTSDGWANQVRVLKLRFDALKASIGQGLINVLTPVIRMLNELMQYLQKAADAFANFTATLFGKAGGSSASSSISSASAELAENTESAAGSAEKIRKSLSNFDQLNILTNLSAGGAGGAGGSAINQEDAEAAEDVAESTSAASAFAEKLKKFFEDIKKYAPEIKECLVGLLDDSGFFDLFEKMRQSVTNLGTGFENIGTSFEGAMENLKPKFAELTNQFTTTFTTVNRTVNGIVGDMWLGLSEGFDEFTVTHGAEIQTFFEGVIGSLTQFSIDTLAITDDIFLTLEEWWNNDGITLWNDIVRCLQDIGGWFLKIWNEFIQPIIDTIIKEAKQLWDEHLKPLWRKILEFISSVGRFFMMLWNNVLKPIVDWIIENVLPVIRPIIEAIIKIVKDVFGVVSDVIGGILDILGGLLDFLTGVFTGDWDLAWNGVKKIFYGIWSSFGGLVCGVANIIIDLLNGLWSAIYAALRKVINGIGSVIKSIGKILGKDTWGFTIPEQAPLIPRLTCPAPPELATGGYVKANTPQLAIIGDNKREGEIVAPESKIAEAVAKGFSMVMAKLQGQNNQKGAQPIYLTVKLGENDFWSGFVDYHNSIVKMTGESPLLV